MRDPREVEDVYRSSDRENEGPNREDELLKSEDESSKSPVFKAGRHDIEEEWEGFSD